MITQTVRMSGLLLLAFFCGAISGVSHASTLRVEAPIVSIEPVHQDGPPVCDLPAPPRSQGLVAALKWDLQGRCRESDNVAVVSGYLVTYEWDGKRLTTLTKARPVGETLPLRLEIN